MPVVAGGHAVVLQWSPALKTTSSAEQSTHLFGDVCVLVTFPIPEGGPLGLELS
jgi:hypothetical protein